MWNNGVSSLIGVHTGGDKKGKNFGTVFFDEKGLVDIFSSKDNVNLFKDFMKSIRSYDDEL